MNNFTKRKIIKMHTGWRSAVLPLHGRTFADKKTA